MFSTLLVANRGEIALRVMRAARAAGLRIVGVYSDADRDAPHVRAADTAVRLGPAPAEESYLSIPALLDAARRTGAEAVHPGYGFLSESAAFARACEDAGLVFVGPPSAVVELMGRKDAARRVAHAAGVPIVPAVEGADDAGLAAAATAEIGLPVLVKAAAGGGGKGIRVVRDGAELPGALAAARRETAAAFGDDTLIVERYVERGRHIEVQVLADTHGTVLHLHERDCSVQRRHQKVVEESPAPTISSAVRELVTDGAVRLAREVGYVGAGTVEFLVAGEEAWFLEMNTRLQVEHPVTEAVTGLDLVTLQLVVAQGRPLPLTQGDVTVSGHAIEVRVYAEDPAHGFLPQAGTTTAVRWPEHARVDAALEDGQQVGTWYDPLLGKITTRGAGRPAARRAMVAALDDAAILGLTTNLGFLRRLVDSDEYADAAIDTAWLDRTPGAFAHTTPQLALCAAAWLLARSGRTEPDHPFGAGDGWRLSGPPAPITLELEHANERYSVHVEQATGTVHVGGRARQVREAASPPGRVCLEIDGIVERFVAEVADDRVAVAHQGESYAFAVPDRLTADHTVLSDGLVTAPMPGLVRDVGVHTGQQVSAGDLLGVLEAMKMETTLVAPHDGTVEDVRVEPGDQVTLGQALFTVTLREES